LCFCLDPPQLLAQLARESYRLRAPVATVARAAKAPTVERSTPAIHLLEDVVAEEHDARGQTRAVAGPQIRFGDYNRDKSQQSTTINPAAESGMSRKTTCKSP
jgi:hypothetical protein